MRRRASATFLAAALLVGMVSAPAVARDGGDRSHGKDSRGDCDRSRNCSDDDFHIERSRIVVCLPQSSCTFGPDEQAINVDPACPPIPYPHCDPYPTALIPPDPAKLAAAIQAGAAGIGKAAGELAGAIAALPPAILL